ncbi:MAG: hypothetical protein LBS09_10210 [Bacteroidales bacterium]|nr:hypothetical protein [Bacteroidales bacterium]
MKHILLISVCFARRFLPKAIAKERSMPMCRGNTKRRSPLSGSVSALDWYVCYLNLILPGWETKTWTEEERKQTSYRNTAIDRVAALKVD